MSKNIVIFSMSPFLREPKEMEYTDKTKQFKSLCIHTNETALKFIQWRLNQNSQNINAVYALVSEEVLKNDFDKFKKLFNNVSYSINPISLFNNGELEGSFKSICDMFDVLSEIIKENEDTIIHVDMTGGLRHSTMVILALMQVLKYSGAKIGMVLYTNFNKKVVEDASELMELFTLIGGADEFITFGNVNQIKKYFKNRNNISNELKFLLNQMENISETIKVCSRYEEMIEALNLLNNAINLYKIFLNCSESKNICEQELFFTKLLSTIEKEYAEILPNNEKNASIPEIIKWCAKKGFLQQAVTFYTEWLPIYIIEEKIIEIKDQTIIEECNKQKQEWSSWEMFFLKSYTLKDYISENSNTLSYKELRLLLDENLSLSKILKKISGKNYKFEEFIKTAITHFKNIKIYNFVYDIMNLPKDNIIKIILNGGLGKNPNTTLYNYLETRINKTNSPEKVLLDALSNNSRNDIIKLFEFSDNNQSDEKLNKISEREETFINLLDKNLISTKLSRENLIILITNYIKYVTEWRNQFNHANSNSANKDSNKLITEAIINNLELLNINN